MITSALLLALLPLSISPVLNDVVLDGEETSNEPQWSGGFQLIYWEVSGNTETTNASFYGDILRETAHERYEVRLDTIYTASVDGTTGKSSIDDRRTSLEGKYDYLAGERHYYFATVGTSADENANIDLRYFAGVGAGYDFYDTETFHLDGEAGLAYVSEDYDVDKAIVPKLDDEETFVELRVGYNLKWDITERTVIGHEVRVAPAIDDFDNVVVSSDASISTKFTDNLVGALRWIVDWDNRPAPGAKTTDRRIAVTLGWSFNR